MFARPIGVCDPWVAWDARGRNDVCETSDLRIPADLKTAVAAHNTIVADSHVVAETNLAPVRVNVRVVMNPNSFSQLDADARVRGILSAGHSGQFGLDPVSVTWTSVEYHSSMEYAISPNADPLRPTKLDGRVYV